MQDVMTRPRHWRHEHMEHFLDSSQHLIPVLGPQSKRLCSRNLGEATYLALQTLESLPCNSHRRWGPGRRRRRQRFDESTGVGWNALTFATAVAIVALAGLRRSHRHGRCGSAST